MKYFAFILPFILSGCSFNSESIKRLDFPYGKGYEAVYATQSVLFKEDGTIQTTQSASLYFKIHRDLSERNSKSHEWLLLPGSGKKEMPDTMLSIIDSSGLYHFYGPDILPEGAKEIQLISLPLTAGKVWESHYLSFPAKATFLEKDSLISTAAGDFKTFAIQYEFKPYYMDEDFIRDKTKQEVRAVLIDYYSPEAGKVLSEINYYVTDRKSGNKLWKILSNKSVLAKLTLPEK
jgi:hypothetical protein